MSFEIGFPSRDELSVISDMAKTLLPTGFLPKDLDSTGKVMAVLLKGRELGLAPMQSVSALYIIDGKASLSAEAMLALVIRSGHWVEFVETTPERCTVRGHRNDETKELTYSMEDASRFEKKEYGKWMPASQTRNYRGHPAAMLRARAISAICRILYPDVIMGLVTPDEAEEIEATMIEAPSGYDLGAPFPPQPAPDVPGTEDLEYPSDQHREAWRHLAHLMQEVPTPDHVDIVQDVMPASSIEEIGDALVRARGYHQTVLPKIAAAKSKVGRLTEKLDIPAEKIAGMIAAMCPDGPESMTLSHWEALISHLAEQGEQEEGQKVEMDQAPKPVSKAAPESDESRPLPLILKDIRALSAALGGDALLRAKKQAGVTGAGLGADDAPKVLELLKGM